MQAAERTAKGAVTNISCQFFANDTSKSLPHVIHIGDILRIHRATVSVYHDQKQLNCNLWKSSSWTIFKGTRSIQRTSDQTISLTDDTGSRSDDSGLNYSKEDAYMPIANSGEKYSFHESEIAILD